MTENINQNDEESSNACYCVKCRIAERMADGAEDATIYYPMDDPTLHRLREDERRAYDDWQVAAYAAELDWLHWERTVLAVRRYREKIASKDPQHEAAPPVSD